MTDVIPVCVSRLYTSRAMIRVRKLFPRPRDKATFDLTLGPSCRLSPARTMLVFGPVIVNNGIMASGSMHCPASSTNMWLKCPRLTPRPYGTPPDIHVDTITLYVLSRSSDGTAKTPFPFMSEKSLRLVGRCLHSLEAAFSLKSCVGPRTSSL